MDVAAYRYRTVPNECLLVPSTLLHVYIETIKARVHYSTFKPSIERRICFVQNFIELSEPKAMINMEYNSNHKHWWLLWYYKRYRVVFKRNSQENKSGSYLSGTYHAIESCSLATSLQYFSGLWADWKIKSSYFFDAVMEYLALRSVKDNKGRWTAVMALCDAGRCVLNARNIPRHIDIRK